MSFNDILFAVFSVSLFVLVSLVFWKEAHPEWEEHQRAFYERLAEKTGDPQSRHHPLKINQIWIAELNRADRCTICHLGIENPAFSDAPQPFTVHPYLDDYMSKHPFDRFGCTVCHDGNGRAVRFDKTHGFVKHLDRQPLSGAYVQSSCTRCHVEFYSPDVEFESAPELMRGKRLFFQLGCGACHSVRQLGTVSALAPDLSDFGSKSELAFDLLHDFTYPNLKGEHSMRNWEWEHFQDPLKIMPGDPAQNIPPTIMPNFGLDEREANALTIFVMSLKDRQLEGIPPSYIPGIESHEEFIQYR